MCFSTLRREVSTFARMIWLFFFDGPTGWRLVFPVCLWAGLCFAQAPDSVRAPVLPFAIDPSKRLPDIELEDKKEGSFITGIPRFEFDPIRGFGAGGNLNLFVNKDREDPFFAYTPYRHQVNAEFFIFQNGRIRYAVNYDAPYLFNTPWRLRADMVHWEDPSAQYWGIGRSTLNALQFRDKRSGEETRVFRKVKEYEENLAIVEVGPDGLYYTDRHYHEMQQREQLYNILGERVFFGGRLRLMFGYEALFTSFSSYQGHVVDDAPLAGGGTADALHRETLVDIQRNDGTWDRFHLAGFINGSRKAFTSMLAGALIYDTRDFEPDPSRGLFLQYSHEFSPPWLGSDFHFHKFMVQGQFFHTLARWRGQKSRLTLGGLLAFGHIFGPRINFIEMWDLSSQAEAGGILVLGGARSLRGYREARFLAPTTVLMNLETRVRFYDFRLLNQHVSLGVVPFFDAGSVFDRPADLSLREWRWSSGVGARIGWNQSTVLRFDVAGSREGVQSFFGFGHIF